MYRTEKFGLVSCRSENQILAELDRDLKRKRKKHRKRRKRGNYHERYKRRNYGFKS